MGASVSVRVSVWRKTNKSERGQRSVVWCRTYNATQNVAFAGVLVFHTEVSKDGGLVLFDCAVVHFSDLSKLVGMDKIHGWCADEFVGFIAC